MYLEKNYRNKILTIEIFTQLLFSFKPEKLLQQYNIAIYYLLIRKVKKWTNLNYFHFINYKCMGEKIARTEF